MSRSTATGTSNGLLYTIGLESNPISLDMIPRIAVDNEDWVELLTNPRYEASLSAAFSVFLRECRWFGGKGRSLRWAGVEEILAVPSPEDSLMVLLKVFYCDGGEETYFVPMVFETMTSLDSAPEDGLILHLETGKDCRPVVVRDALYSPEFIRTLVRTISQKADSEDASGYLSPIPGCDWRLPDIADLKISLVSAEQSNSSVNLGNSLIFKLFRRIWNGRNPEVEMGEFLTRQNFKNIARLRGGLEYEKTGRERRSLWILQEFIPNLGDAWSFYQDDLASYYRKLLREGKAGRPPSCPPRSPLSLSEERATAPEPEQIGSSLDLSNLLGKRTAELHLTLSGGQSQSGFRPEEITTASWRNLLDSMKQSAERTLSILVEQLPVLPRDIQAQAEELMKRKAEVSSSFESAAKAQILGQKIRCHGDFHLGQVLVAGNDFFFIDFEGEPQKPIPERRKKRSPLVDIACMLRSFSYASYSCLWGKGFSKDVSEGWARVWSHRICHSFLMGYLGTVGNARLIPHGGPQLEVMLRTFLLDKALYELEYELNNRPAWINIPIQGILEILELGPDPTQISNG